jgi:hypothetical protein
MMALSETAASRAKRHSRSDDCIAWKAGVARSALGTPTLAHVPRLDGAHAHRFRVLSAMDGAEVFTLVLAGYSAMLSSVLGYLTWRRDRRALIVRSSFFFRVEEAGITVQAVNAGFRAVTVSDVLFERDDPDRSYIAHTVEPLEGSASLPVKLDDGGEASFRFALDDLPRDFTAILVRDAFRREYRVYRDTRFDEDFRALESAWALMHGRDPHEERIPPAGRST